MLETGLFKPGVKSAASLAAALLAGVGLFTIASAHGGDTSLIHACISTSPGGGQSAANSGSVRIVGANEDCRSGETPLHWSQFGQGDITAVVAGTGLDGGGTSDSVTLSIKIPLSLTASNNSDNIISGTNNGLGGGVFGQGRTVGVQGVSGEPPSNAGGSEFTLTAGVVGSTTSNKGTGVFGFSNGAGVYGRGNEGPGVYGSSTNGHYGVQGEGNVAGVYGLGGTGTGVQGKGGPYGVTGSSEASNGTGVWGDASRDAVIGVRGTSQTGDGVLGEVPHSSSSAAAIHGRGILGGRSAGLFEGDVKVTGTINGTVVGTSSDRAVKDNFASVDRRQVLEGLATMPLESWNYKSEDPSVRHLGPMAQDFAAAFGVGQDDKHIATVDADGVAFAAIQGLYQIVQEKDAELANQGQQLAELERQNSMLEARLAALEERLLTAVVR